MNIRNVKLDAHFHLDLYENYQQILKDVSNQNIYILAMTNTPSVFFFTKNLSKKYPSVLPSIGLHPELVNDRYSELDLLLNKISTERYIGEVGLDYSSKYSLDDRKLQRDVFEKVLLKCSEIGRRVISIHSRKAASDVIKMVSSDFPGTIILHWYSGGLGDLDKAIERNFFFSVNPAMVKSKSGKKIISRIPQNKILTETDGPFLELDNQPVEPQTIVEVITYLSEIWEYALHETYSIIAKNVFSAGILDSK